MAQDLRGGGLAGEGAVDPAAGNVRTRQRLGEAVAKALHDLGEDEGPYFIEWESESESDRTEYRKQADAAIAVFAQWLREEARQAREQSMQMETGWETTMWGDRERHALRLADMIEPKQLATYRVLFDQLSTPR